MLAEESPPKSLPPADIARPGRLITQLTVFPVALVKGLEFDAVVVWDADTSHYGETPFEARLLYVALTRALHELYVCAVGELSGLLREGELECKL